MAPQRSKFPPVLMAIGLACLAFFGYQLWSPAEQQGPPVAGVSGASEPLTPPIAAPVGLHPVAPFNPSRIVVQSQDGVLVSSELDPDVIVARQNESGRWQNIPGDLPGMVLDPERQPHRVRPGYPSGTSVVLGHAKVHPAKVFTPLMQVPTDKATLRDKRFEAFLYGPNCQALTYSITSVEIPLRGQPQGHLHQNLPNRLLIYTCEVISGQIEVTHNRVLVGELTSAVGSCS